jgi:hypothetical protein
MTVWREKEWWEILLLVLCDGEVSMGKSSDMDRNEGLVFSCIRNRVGGWFGETGGARLCLMWSTIQQEPGIESTSTKWKSLPASCLSSDQTCPQRQPWRWWQWHDLINENTSFLLSVQNVFACVTFEKLELYNKVVSLQNKKTWQWFQICISFFHFHDANW